MENLSERLDHMDSLLKQEQAAEAEALCRETLQHSLAPHERAQVLDRLGRARHAQDALTDARDSFQKALDLLAQPDGTLPASPTVAVILQHLSRAYVSLRDLERAYAHGNEALAMLVTLLGTEHQQVAAARFGLSFVAYNARKYDEAEALSREAMRLWQLHQGPKSFEISTCLNNLGRIYEERGDLDAGIALHRQSVAMRREILGVHPETGFALGNLGTALASDGQWAEAADILKEAIACYEQSGRGTGYEVDGYRRNLAVCEQALQD